MNKPKSYLNHSDSGLLRYLQRIAQDIKFCEDKADEFGFGAAGDHYRRAAAEAKREAERARAELEHRGVIQ